MLEWRRLATYRKVRRMAASIPNNAPVVHFTPSQSRYQFILLGEQRHTWVNNLRRVAPSSGTAGNRTLNLSITNPTPYRYTTKTQWQSSPGWRKSRGIWHWSGARDCREATLPLPEVAKVANDRVKWKFHDGKLQGTDAHQWYIRSWVTCLLTNGQRHRVTHFMLLSYWNWYCQQIQYTSVWDLSTASAAKTNTTCLTFWKYSISTGNRTYCYCYCCCC